ncbi:ABC transporter permease [Streptomyces graminilatus]|uniref:ABC transporter permease n=1 Tax=Streptomyces graminilatus TaxID=1464070 RepID=UPI0006E23709|nr:ABC transporter permease [Streptomyces graminilatus]
MTTPPTPTPTPTPAPRWRALTQHHLFWPVAVLVVLLLINVPFTPGFFSIKMTDGHLYGSLVSIVLFGSPLILVAVGMTLVIATGGIDLSVGAVVAITGALTCSYISDQADQDSLAGVFLAMGIGLVAAVVCGLWNGFLVARMGIQPIIATLIIMVAGRGVAQLITDGQIITINSEPYKLIGGGYWLTLPFSIFVVAAVVAITVALTRRTALGLLVESVGGNAEASRLVGIRSTRIKIMVYVFCALCAGIAGLMISSNTSAADGNNAGLWIELDAILAVVIGGTSLLGGRFSIGGTVVGALVIQTLTTTIYTIGVPTQTNLVFKAAVVIVVCLLQSPKFRTKVFGGRFGSGSGAKGGGASAGTPADTAQSTAAAPKMEVS